MPALERRPRQLLLALLLSLALSMPPSCKYPPTLKTQDPKPESLKEGCRGSDGIRDFSCCSHDLGINLHVVTI